METTTTWHELITEALHGNSEDWDDVEVCTLSQEELHSVFIIDYGEAPWKPFRLWTHHRVYFSIDYDGKVSVGSVFRNPSRAQIHHIA